MKKFPQTTVLSKREHRASYSTKLFPKNIPLEALAAAAMQANEGDFTLLSVGCNIGAELDSSLAHVFEQGAQNVRAIGIDCHAPVLEEARRGKYRTLWRRPPGFRSAQIQAFQHLDFGINKRPYGLDISAVPLRQKAEEVAFVQADVKEALPYYAANLIMCHNVLCCISKHGDSETAFQAVDNLHDSLAPGGVLSLAMMPYMLKGYESGAEGYPTLHRQVTEKLLGQAMEPVVFDYKSNAPIAFRRQL